MSPCVRTNTLIRIVDSRYIYPGRCVGISALLPPIGSLLSFHLEICAAFPMELIKLRRKSTTPDVLFTVQMPN